MYVYGYFFPLCLSKKKKNASTDLFLFLSSFYKQCPGCDAFIERTQTGNLSVQCTFCTARTGKTYEFCWQCLKQWKGRQPRSDRCDNEGCRDANLDLLKNCEPIILKSVQNIECPSVRACPNCGTLLNTPRRNVNTLCVVFAGKNSVFFVLNSLHCVWKQVHIS